MNTFTRICIALLCGVALIWLVHIAAALLAAAPGLGALIRWLKSNDLPTSLVSPLLLSFVPVVVVSALVGTLVFRLPERRAVLFVSVAAPFVLYALYTGIGMQVSVGNSFASSVLHPMPWLSACMAPVGLTIALLTLRAQDEA